jgi:hypothetical protein
VLLAGCGPGVDWDTRLLITGRWQPLIANSRQRFWLLLAEQHEQTRDHRMSYYALAAEDKNRVFNKTGTRSVLPVLRVGIRDSNAVCYQPPFTIQWMG